MNSTKFISTDDENMLLSIDLSFISIQQYSDLISYIKSYKTYTLAYYTNLLQLQNDYNSKLSKQTTNPKIKIFLEKFRTLTNIIPEIVKQQINNYKIFFDLINKNLKTFEDEKELILIDIKKYQHIYNTVKNDLLSKFNHTKKLKSSFINNISNTEDIIYNFYENENNNKKINDEENDAEDKMNENVEKSKKLEDEYKMSINYLKIYQNNYREKLVESFNIIKKQLINISLKLKDTIFNFLISIKGCFKVPLNNLDTHLNYLTKLNDKNITNTDLIFNKKNNKNIKNTYLNEITPIKYNLKIFDNDKIVVIEDGFGQMSNINNTTALKCIKKMYANFELLQKNYFNIDIEKEKTETFNLLSKIIDNIQKNNDNSKNNINDINNNISTEEISKLKILLNKHHNRVVFLQLLNNYRSKGKFELPMNEYKILGDLLIDIMNTVQRDKDYHSAKNTIILSQTYYYKIDNKNKLYLQTYIQNMNIFKQEKFWDDLLTFAIDKQIVDQKKSNIKKDEFEKEKQKVNTVYGHLLSFVDNMIDFGLETDSIRNIIEKRKQKYNLDEKLIKDVEVLIDNRRNKKNVKEEINNINNKEDDKKD